MQHTLARLIDWSRPLVFTAGVVFAVLVAIGCASRLSPAFPNTRTASVLDGSALGQINTLLDKTLHAAPLETTLWGIDVRSIDRNERVYTNNPDLLLTPASTLKS